MAKKQAPLAKKIKVPSLDLLRKWRERIMDDTRLRWVRSAEFFLFTQTYLPFFDRVAVDGSPEHAWFMRSKSMGHK